MPLPVHSLPVLQHWDCHGCTDCCREYLVGVTEEERQRIEAQGWQDDPAFEGVKLFAKHGSWWNRRYGLNHRPDGACVFLNEQGGCRIHAKFGSAAKPLACRVYPFVLIPAGDHWEVGLRFACPSAAGDQGRPLNDHLPDLRVYVAGLEKQEHVSRQTMPAPPTHRGQSFNWADFNRFIRAFVAIVTDPTDRLERRLRKCLALAQLCRQAHFRTVSGARLQEFLDLVSVAVEEETPRDPAQVPRPGWIGRVLFRQALALFVRKDTGPRRGISRSGRLALMWAAWRFARGTGKVPRLHTSIPAGVRFAQLEEPAGPIPESTEQLLTRYYHLKLTSHQFCGPTNFNLPIWDGLASLMLTFPAICWLARVLQDRPREEAFLEALRIVDDNFGFNTMLGSGRQKYGIRVLAQRGELDRLIAWYGR